MHVRFFFLHHNIIICSFIYDRLDKAYNIIHLKQSILCNTKTTLWNTDTGRTLLCVSGHRVATVDTKRLLSRDFHFRKARMA